MHKPNAPVESRQKRACKRKFLNTSKIFKYPTLPLSCNVTPQNIKQHKFPHKNLVVLFQIGNKQDVIKFVRFVFVIVIINSKFLRHNLKAKLVNQLIHKRRATAYVTIWRYRSLDEVLRGSVLKHISVSVVQEKSSAFTINVSCMLELDSPFHLGIVIWRERTLIGMIRSHVAASSRKS